MDELHGLRSRQSFESTFPAHDNAAMMRSGIARPTRVSHATDTWMRSGVVSSRSKQSVTSAFFCSEAPRWWFPIGLLTQTIREGSKSTFGAPAAGALTGSLRGGNHVRLPEADVRGSKLTTTLTADGARAERKSLV